jgi:oligopeptide transport system substrate-binding protein
LSACHPPSKPPSSLRINLKAEPTTLDPRKGGDLCSSTLHFLLFEGLTRLNPDGTITPAQAKTIKISEDRKLYTFFLKNTLWSDGTPVTAYDFEYAWKSMLAPDFPSPNAHLLYPIKNAEAVKRGLLPVSELGVLAVNATTLQVELTQPTPYFLDLISFCSFAPAKRFDAPHSVYNGPFILKKWKHAEELIVSKNPLYWAAHTIDLDSIHMSFISHEMTIWHLYEKGALDLIDMEISPIPIAAQLELADKNLLRFRPTPSSTVCVFNTQSHPFHNVHIRRAFALAIDRQSLVENITQRQEEIGLQLVPPSLKEEKITPFIRDHDQVEALKELELGLNQLGIDKTALQGLVYSYCNSERNHMIAQALQQQWLDTLGIHVNLKTYELKLHMSNLFKKNFQMTQAQLIAQYNDPMNFLERFNHKESAKNYPGWENPTYSALIASSFLEFSPEKRLKILNEAEALFMEEMPLTPLYHGTSALLAQPHLHNIQLFKNGNPDFTKLSIQPSE